jgi:hypothetical protein
MEKILVNTTFNSRIVRKPRQRWYNSMKTDVKHWDTRGAVG